MKKKYGKVAVLMGGRSAEREISLKSGVGVLNALLSRGVDAHKVDVGDDIIDVLRHGEFDRAFVILHGREGEDGRMQALLEALKIPYTGSGVAASALCMDKYRAKLVVDALGIKTPRFVLIDQHFSRDKIAHLHLPLAVKPLHEGSSFGITRVDDLKDLDEAIKTARDCKDEVLIEEWIQGREYTVPIIANKALPSIKVSTPKREFYDFASKYQNVGTIFECPNDLSTTEENNLLELSMKAYHGLGCRDWARVDFMLGNDGEFYFIEMNSLPGMTPTSLPFRSASTVGMSYEDIVMAVLDASMDTNRSA